MPLTSSNTVIFLRYYITTSQFHCNKLRLVTRNIKNANAIRKLKSLWDYYFVQNNILKVYSSLVITLYYATGTQITLRQTDWLYQHLDLTTPLITHSIHSRELFVLSHTKVPLRCTDNTDFQPKVAALSLGVKTSCRSHLYLFSFLFCHRNRVTGYLYNIIIIIQISHTAVIIFHNSGGGRQ